MCCLGDEWMSLCLIKACKYVLWLGNDLISSFEMIKIPPLLSLNYSQKGKIIELGILMQLIRIVWDYGYMKINGWKKGRKFQRKEKRIQPMLVKKEEDCNFSQLINVEKYVLKNSVELSKG